MKFSELDKKSWPALQPYLDTCLLPVSGLIGDESPWEAADKVAETGQWLAPLENDFKGRTVTLPAFHYYGATEQDGLRLEQLIQRLKSAGFRYVVVVCGRRGFLDAIDADLAIQPAEDGERPDPERLHDAVTSMWSNK